MLSRLKGIETMLLMSPKESDTPLDMLSRLKGIETKRKLLDQTRA